MPASRRLLSPVLPLALTVAGALALGGCGDGGDDPTPAASGSLSSTQSGAPRPGSSGALDQNGLDACNKVDEAARITGDDPLSTAQRTRLLFQAADSARQSSVPQIRDVPSLVGGTVGGSGGNALDQIRGICTGLGWTPS